MSNIELTAYWGDDDASSTIKISEAQWKKIQAGAGYEKSGWSWYEGIRYQVTWVFKDKTYSVHGPDGAEYVLDESVDDLIQF